MKALKQTILLGVFFLLLVTTYNSFSYIVTFIYENKAHSLKEMGPIILGINYFTFLITNSFVPAIRLKLTIQMKIAALCYTLNYLAQIFTPSQTWGIVLSVLGAVSGGFGAALLWVCYGAYMKNLCIINNEEEIQGKYFAIVNGITFASIICGAVVTTFCLAFTQNQTYFIILSSLGFISFLFCHFLIKQVTVQKNNVKEQQINWYIQLTKSIKYYKQMIAILPTIILDGLILAFVSNASAQLMPQNSVKLDVGIFLIIMGSGCILGAFLSGYLSDKLRMKNVGKLSIGLIFIVSAGTAIVNKYMRKDVAFICAVFWGITRQFIQGWLYVACSRNYNGRLQSYANMKQLHSLSFCCYMFVLALTKLELQNQYIMMAFVVICPVCFFFLDHLPKPVKQIDSGRQYLNNQHCQSKQNQNKEEGEVVQISGQQQ